MWLKEVVVLVACNELYVTEMELYVAAEMDGTGLAVGWGSAITD